ncbi:MAG: 50S ribosomal protein L3 N(5)-glutamine methyltransferase [Gammaproteobacteria bacterium]
MNTHTRYDNAATELHTIMDFLRWAVTEFERVPVYYGHGTDNAWDEAMQLILSALNLPSDIPQVFSANLLQSEKQMLAQLVEKRTQERIPSAYLTHQAWFAGMRFYVDERVLIPRSPLGELILQHFSPWLPEDQPVDRVLDIGTGSGCIACACAHAFPDAVIDAVDISDDALAVAQKNVQEYGLEERVNVIQSDIFSALGGQTYDLIISNPPYVDRAEMDALPPEFLHEPRLGLAAGEDGLDCVRVILQQAKQHLTPHGLLIIEVGYSADALSSAFPLLPFTWIELEQGGMGVFVLNAADL